MNDINTKDPLINNMFSVLIPDGESRHSLPALQCLSEFKNIKLYVLSNDSCARIRFSKYLTNFFTYPKEEGDEGRLSAIYDIVKNHKIDIVLPIDQKTIRLLSVHQKELSEAVTTSLLPKTETFDIANNKWLLSEWLKQKNIPSPTTILYQAGKTSEQDLSGISFPALIKPIQGTGGEGIMFFDTPAELLKFASELTGSMDYIIQSFIKGYDIDCNILCQNGKILAYSIQKECMAAYHRFEPAAGIDFVHNTATYEVVKELMEQLQWSGVAHVDLRYDEQSQQFNIIEINPRFWASIHGSLTAGINFPYLACLAGLHIDFPEVDFQAKRFVKSKMAIKMQIQRLFCKNRPDLQFDGSNLDYILKDPLPNIIEVMVNFYRESIKPMFKKA